MVKTRYMAHTSLGFWSFSRPQTTPEKAIRAAENQVSRILLDRLGVTYSIGFAAWLRSNHPDVVSEAHDYIGEVRQVVLLVDELPREFRYRYCNVSFLGEAARVDSLGESFA